MIFFSMRKPVFNYRSKLKPAEYLNFGNAVR